MYILYQDENVYIYRLWHVGSRSGSPKITGSGSWSLWISDTLLTDLSSARPCRHRACHPLRLSADKSLNLIPFTGVYYIGAYFRLPDHSISDMKTVILERCKNNYPTYRKLRESFFINKFNSQINRMNKKRNWYMNLTYFRNFEYINANYNMFTHKSNKRLKWMRIRPDPHPHHWS